MFRKKKITVLFLFMSNWQFAPVLTAWNYYWKMPKHTVLFIWDIKLKSKLIRCICLYWRNWILVYKRRFSTREIFLSLRHSPEQTFSERQIGGSCNYSYLLWDRGWMSLDTGSISWRWHSPPATDHKSLSGWQISESLPRL